MNPHTAWWFPATKILKPNLAFSVENFAAVFAMHPRVVTFDVIVPTQSGGLKNFPAVKAICPKALRSHVIMYTYAAFHIDPLCQHIEVYMKRCGLKLG